MPQTYAISLTPDQLRILFNTLTDKVTTHPGPYDGPEYRCLVSLLETLYLNTVPQTNPNPLL